MKAILHCDRNWGIGKKNDLMFRLPKDMKFFRSTTLNKTVVMGSNTLLSFPEGKPLPKRNNIVLWPGGDKERAKRDGFLMVESLPELFALLSTLPEEDIFIIGGAEAFFDNLDSLPSWREVASSGPIDDNGYTIRFTTYRNSSPLPLK